MKNLFLSPLDKQIAEAEADISRLTYLLSEAETIEVTFASRMEILQREINLAQEKQQALIRIKDNSASDKKTLPRRLEGAKEHLASLLRKRSGELPEKASRAPSLNKKAAKKNETPLEKLARLQQELAELQKELQ